MEDDGDLAMNPTPSLAATSNSSLGDSMEIIMNPNRLLAGLSKRLRPFTLVSKAIAAFLLIATAMLAGLSGCSSDEQGHGLAAQNDSWVIAPRLLAENMDNEEFSTARWVRVQASRDGRVIAFEEVAYAKHSVTLTIPSAGDVKLSITGYNDSNRTMVMWSGTTDVPSGTASPVISVGKGPGLIPVPSPRFSLAAGTFKEAKKVALGVDSANLEIHYTLDGGDPSETSPVYRDSLLIEKTTTLRAIAWRKGRALSKIEEAHYVITLDTVVAPAFSLPAAKYRGWRKLSITSGTEGASIHYTTNGNEPNESSPKYSDSLEITSSMTIKAVALKKGMERSLVTTSSYTITLDTLKDPKFSPEGDRYTSAQDVVITSDSGATIHYTTDGSSPSVNSSRFEGSLRVEGSATIKAIAVRKGSVSSSIVTTKYTITPPGTLSAPEFDPVAGEYKTARNVAIRADSGVTIRYTLDNSAPTTSSPVYGGPILVSSSQVIKAIALKEGMTTSVPGVASYAIRPDTVDAPRFSLEPGTYEAGTTLAMLCDTTEASIHFTLDGSEPTGLSPKYLRPIALDTSVKVSAIALKDGLVKSEIARVDYVIRALGAVAAPVFDPPEAVYDTAKWVTIKSDTSNAVIYYTTNGSTPDSTSQRYTKPFVVAASQTIKAIAMKVGRPSSNVVSIEYAIREKGRVEAPQFTPNGGDFSAPASVEILSATDSAVIRYTVNGDEPTAASERYSKPLLISTSQVLRAIALKDGFTNSALSEAKFTIKPPDTVAMPTVSPEVKGFTGSGKVGIATATAGAKIYYTTNDSEPSDASMFYSDSIEILSSLTLKAIAMRDGMVPSKVATVKFTVTPLDTVAVPKFDIDSGSYAQAQVVSISSVTTGADIHYTTDGTQPTTASAKVSGSIKVDSSMTIKAIATRLGMVSSASVSSAYRIMKKVEMPTFNVEAGTYTTPQTVSISCATSGASIYYTVNGAEPSPSSAKYMGVIDVASSQTVKALAIADGMTPSDIAKADYVIEVVGTVATPTFTPAGGIFAGSASVKISSTTPDATIYYTLDGTVPTISSNVFSGAFSVTSDITVKAIAVKTNMKNSGIGSAAFKLQETAAQPTFSVPTGTYTAAQSVTLSSATPGAAIYYTIDGTTPTTGSKLYSSAIPVSATQTIQAIAVATGMTNSTVGSAKYTISIPTTVAMPTFSVATGTYTTVQTVTIACATTGASIYYTLDGTAPTISSAKYGAALSIASTKTLKAIAVKEGATNSGIATATYTIQLATVQAPTFSAAALTFLADKINIQLSSATTGATIHYTTDGTTPTDKSPPYTAAIPVDTTQTIKAIAVKDGMLSSAVSSTLYTMKNYAPVFSPAGGDTTYTGAISVTMTSSTTGATIHYTIDGTTPTASSKVYSRPVTVSYDQTLKAIAVKDGRVNSSVTSSPFDVNIYGVKGSPAAVQFSVKSGTYLVGQTVTLSSATSGAVIHYTADWSEPTESSPIYKTPLNVSKTMTIKARAFITTLGSTYSSPVTGENYQIKGTVVQ